MVSRDESVPDRGDAVWITLNPSEGEDHGDAAALLSPLTSAPETVK